MEKSTIALFCCLDDFARMFLDWERHKLINSDRQRICAGIISSEKGCCASWCCSTPWNCGPTGPFS